MWWRRFPYISTLPWKEFLMGQIRKIQKHKEERHRSGKFEKNNMERMEERKRRDFYIHGGSPTHVFCIGRQHQGLRPSCDPPSGEPTHMRTSPTTLNCH